MGERKGSDEERVDAITCLYEQSAAQIVYADQCEGQDQVALFLCEGQKGSEGETTSIIKKASSVVEITNSCGKSKIEYESNSEYRSVRKIASNYITIERDKTHRKHSGSCCFIDSTSCVEIDAEG